MAIYTVQSGDTLGRIASRFGVSVAAIAAANGISNVNLIRVGQRLTIPGAGGITGEVGAGYSAGGSAGSNAGNYAGAIGAATALFGAGAGAIGVPLADMIAIRDAAGRTFGVPRNATVTVRDGNGVLRTLAASAAQAALDFGNGVVMGVTSGGSDVTAAALDAGKKVADKAVSEFKLSSYMTIGLIAIVAVIVLKR